MSGSCKLHRVVCHFTVIAFRVVTIAASVNKLCRRGLLVPMPHFFICCPSQCQTCEESQCISGVSSPCCPASIFKLKRACRDPEDTGCSFIRESRLKSAWQDQVPSAAGTRFQAKQLLHSTSFCRFGKRGKSRDGLFEACCPQHCARCDAGPLCLRRAPDECCLPPEAANRSCVHASNLSCIVHRHELEMDDFEGEIGNDATAADSDVHVVITGDRVQSLGVIASARSVFQSTRRPDRLFLHLVVDPPIHNDIQQSLRCAMSLDDGPRRFRVYSFEIGHFAHIGRQNLTIRAPVSLHKGNLAAGPNFARFYLDKLLPQSIDKVVYLDADTIVLKDITWLYDTSLTRATPSNHAIAAVSRAHKPMCGSYLNCRSESVRLLLRSQRIYNPDEQLDAFNAGIMVIHLRRWRALRLTEHVQFWMNWNSNLQLYRLGSNPPLVLAVRNNFQHLDSRWNCQRMQPCWERGDAAAMHWNGPHKPWNLDNKRDVVEWLPFLRGVLDDGQCQFRSVSQRNFAPIKV